MTRYLALVLVVAAQETGPIRIARFVRPSETSPLAEAAIVARGVTSAPFLDAALVRELETVLAIIRTQLPDLRPAVPEGSFWAVEVMVSDSTAATARTHGRRVQGRFSATWRLSRTGSRELDSLATSFRAESLSLRLGAGPGDRTTPVVRIVFAHAMNLPVVVAALSRVAGVRAAFVSPDDGPQTGHYFSASRTPDGWRVIVDQGQGECQPACDAWVRWTLQIKDDAVRVEGRLPIRQR